MQIDANRAIERFPVWHCLVMTWNLNTASESGEIGIPFYEHIFLVCYLSLLNITATYGAGIRR